MTLPKLKWWQWALGGTFAFVLAGAVFSPHDPAAPVAGPAPKEQTITTAYVESALTDASRLALDRGKRGAPLETVVVKVKTTDAYGNEGTRPLITLAWAPADLAQVNWSRIDRYRLLDLAAVTPDSPDAMLAFRDWCWKRGASGPTLTPRLCSSDGIREARKALSGR